MTHKHLYPAPLAVRSLKHDCFPMTSQTSLSLELATTNSGWSCGRVWMFFWNKSSMMKRNKFVSCWAVNVIKCMFIVILIVVFCTDFASVFHRERALFQKIDYQQYSKSIFTKLPWKRQERILWGSSNGVTVSLKIFLGYKTKNQVILSAQFFLLF